MEPCHTHIDPSLIRNNELCAHITRKFNLKLKKGALSALEQAQENANECVTSEIVDSVHKVSHVDPMDDGYLSKFEATKTHPTSYKNESVAGTRLTIIGERFSNILKSRRRDRAETIEHLKQINDDYESSSDEAPLPKVSKNISIPPKNVHVSHEPNFTEKLFFPPEEKEDEIILESEAFKASIYGDLVIPNPPSLTEVCVNDLFTTEKVPFDLLNSGTQGEISSKSPSQPPSSTQRLESPSLIKPRKALKKLIEDTCALSNEGFVEDLAIVILNHTEMAESVKCNPVKSETNITLSTELNIDTMMKNSTLINENSLNSQLNLLTSNIDHLTQNNPEPQLIQPYIPPLHIADVVSKRNVFPVQNICELKKENNRKLLKLPTISHLSILGSDDNINMEADEQNDAPILLEELDKLLMMQMVTSYPPEGIKEEKLPICDTVRSTIVDNDDLSICLNYKSKGEGIDMFHTTKDNIVNSNNDHQAIGVPDQQNARSIFDGLDRISIQALRDAFVSPTTNRFTTEGTRVGFNQKKILHSHGNSLNLRGRFKSNFTDSSSILLNSIKAKPSISLSIKSIFYHSPEQRISAAVALQSEGQKLRKQTRFPSDNIPFDNLNHLEVQYEDVNKIDQTISTGSINEHTTVVANLNNVQDEKLNGVVAPKICSRTFQDDSIKDCSESSKLPIESSFDQNFFGDNEEARSFFPQNSLHEIHVAASDHLSQIPFVRKNSEITNEDSPLLINEPGMFHTNQGIIDEFEVDTCIKFGSTDRIPSSLISPNISDNVDINSHKIENSFDKIPQILKEETPVHITFDIQKSLPYVDVIPMRAASNDQVDSNAQKESFYIEEKPVSAIFFPYQPDEENEILSNAQSAESPVSFLQPSSSNTSLPSLSAPKDFCIPNFKSRTKFTLDKTVLTISNTIGGKSDKKNELITANVSLTDAPLNDSSLHSISNLSNLPVEDAKPLSTVFTSAKTGVLRIKTRSNINAHLINKSSLPVSKALKQQQTITSVSGDPNLIESGILSSSPLTSLNLPITKSEIEKSNKELITKKIAVVISPDKITSLNSSSSSDVQNSSIPTSEAIKLVEKETSEKELETVEKNKIEDKFNATNYFHVDLTHEFDSPLDNQDSFVPFDIIQPRTLTEDEALTTIEELFSSMPINNSNNNNSSSHDTSNDAYSSNDVMNVVNIFSRSPPSYNLTSRSKSSSLFSLPPLPLNPPSLSSSQSRTNLNLTSSSDNDSTTADPISLTKLKKHTKSVPSLALFTEALAVGFKLNNSTDNDEPSFNSHYMGSSRFYSPRQRQIDTLKKSSQKKNQFSSVNHTSVVDAHPLVASLFVKPRVANVTSLAPVLGHRSMITNPVQPAQSPDLNILNTSTEPHTTQHDFGNSSIIHGFHLNLNKKTNQITPINTRKQLMKLNCNSDAHPIETECRLNKQDQVHNDDQHDNLIMSQLESSVFDAENLLEQENNLDASLCSKSSNIKNEFRFIEQTNKFSRDRRACPTPAFRLKGKLSMTGSSFMTSLPLYSNLPIQNLNSSKNKMISPVVHQFRPEISSSQTGELSRSSTSASSVNSLYLSSFKKSQEQSQPISDVANLLLKDASNVFECRLKTIPGKGKSSWIT